MVENPYLDKVRRAVDGRLGRPADEVQALALVAIAVELQAIRIRLEGDASAAAEPAQPVSQPRPAEQPPSVEQPPPLEPPVRRTVFTGASDGIVIG